MEREQAPGSGDDMPSTGPNAVVTLDSSSTWDEGGGDETDLGALISQEEQQQQLQEEEQEGDADSESSDSGEDI